MNQRNKPEHLYVHVPFCKTICSYCDFVHSVYQTKLVDDWLIALKKEIEYKDINPNLKTIYIGGGTPSCLSNKQLDSLLSLLDPYCKNVIEYTIEVNPETMNEYKALLFKKHHINRISIGLQSTNEKLLKLMNRHHTYEDVKECIHLLKQNGINNISLDIMYSLPFQTMEMLEKTIDDALSFHPTHLSLYSLTIEENTLFSKKGYTSLDEDTEADMYEYLVDTLEKNGFYQYEVSNFSYGDHESMHNQAYWNYRDFYGISSGASGKENHIRYDKTRNLKEYILDPLKRNDLVLDLKDEMFEMLMMGIRLKKGMNLDLFQETFHQSFLEVYGDKIRPLLQKNLVEIDDHYFRCSKQGYEIMNSILVELM